MDRRHFLSTGGGAVVAGCLTGGPSFRPVRRAQAAGEGQPGGGGLEARLAEFALAICYENLPPAVIASAKRVVLDALGCALAAFGTDAASVAGQAVAEAHGCGSAATVAGHAERASIEGAIFANSVLVRALDLNDTYVGTDPLHPSELLPVALAAGETGRMTGRQFIEVVVAGYEVATRVNDAVPFMERGFHPICAMAYAAPVMLGKAWGLPAETVGHAVGMSAVRSYALFGSDSGAIGGTASIGFAASAAEAVLVTRLAAQGFKGPSGTLEWAAMRHGAGSPPPTLDLHSAHYRLPHVAFRQFPVQIELQAVAEAGIRLSRRIGARANDIRAIHVRTDPGVMRRVANAAPLRPETPGTGEQRLPVCLAMALLDGTVNVAQFDAGRWRAPDVMGLVGRTVVAEATEVAPHRRGGRGCSVEILFHDGTMERETVEVAEGEAARPLSSAALEQRFMSFASTVVGDAQAQAIAAAVQDLDRLANVGDLSDLLRPQLG